MSTAADAPTMLVMDLGGVTCRWLPDRRLVELARLSGLPPDTVDRLVFESGFDDAGERGRFPLATFTEELAAVLGLPASPDTDDALRGAWALAFEPEEPVLRLIRSAPCRSALFTNNGPLLEAALSAELSDVGDVFDQLLFSWRLGVTKPNPTAFDRAAETLGVEPGSIFFVDDAADNVEAARRAGWRAHRYSTALDLQAAFSSLNASP